MKRKRNDREDANKPKRKRRRGFEIVKEDNGGIGIKSGNCIRKEREL
jgi:hypothetical protein